MNEIMVAPPVKTRQRLSDSDPQEYAHREADTRQLIDDITARSGDFFATPENRLDFMESQDGESFYRIAQHINARLRGEKSILLRRDPAERGAFLPALHTPSYDDKVPAFLKGYQAIQEYIADSSDSIDKKVSSVAMAVEALCIWVHPFNDGNGRTSRFLAKLIEDGMEDVDTLVEQTISRKSRGYAYTSLLMSKESALKTAEDEDVMLDDDERDEIRLNAESLPSDVDSIYLSIQRLLRDETVQLHAMRHAKQAQSS